MSPAAAGRRRAGREEPPLLEPRDRSAWRAWLEEHYADPSGVLLVVSRKGAPAPTLSYADAVEEAVAFGWIDSRGRRIDGERFGVTFSPRKPGSGWSRSNKERVERLTAAGLMAAPGLAAVERAKANGSWNALDDVEELRMPDDLLAALAADPEAERGFAAFAPSARKMSLYWISTAKRPETRSARIAATVRDAAAGIPRDRP